MFMEDWMKKLIWSVIHIMDGNGKNLMLNIIWVAPVSSIGKLHRISQVFIQLIKSNILNIPTPNLHKVKVDDLDLVNGKCNNKFLRQYLVNTLYPGKTKNWLTLKDYNNSDLSTTRTRNLKFPILSKCKKVCFKTINNIYPSN